MRLTPGPNRVMLATVQRSPSSGLALALAPPPPTKLMAVSTAREKTGLMLTSDSALPLGTHVKTIGTVLHEGAPKQVTVSLNFRQRQQKPAQHCKAIILQLKTKIKKKQSLDEHSENFNKELENMLKKKTKLKETITEKKKYPLWNYQ